ncbi:MAG TPA: FtsX-like permease family protein, partial [Phycisphaeraceae bacterium]
VDYLMAFQFDFTQRQDMNVTFVEPSSAQAVYDVRSLPGVMRAEPFRSVAARLRHGHRERRVAIMGIEPGGTLYRVVDDQRGPLELPPDGLVMSVKLAELLQVRPGQMVTVQVREGKRPVRQVPVADLVDDFAGTNAYMNVHALRRLMQEGGTVSGVFLRVDEARTNQLYLALKQTPRVASVTVKRAMVESFEQTISENQQRIRMFNVAFAIVIAFGVVYNTVRISLAENSRELATLRVIGFSRAEVSAILLGELAVLTLAAIPVGLMMGYGLAWLATLSVNTEMFRIPLVVSRATLGFASAVVLAAALGSGLVVRRRIDRLDLVSVLKAKE